MLDAQSRMNALNELERPLYNAVLQIVRSVVGEDAFVGISRDLVASTYPATQTVLKPDHNINLIWDALCQRAPGPFAAHCNTAVHDPVAREKIAGILAGIAPGITIPSPPPEILARFRHYGFLKFPPLLQPAQVGALAGFLSSRPNLHTQGSTHRNTLADIVAAPHMLALATHPPLLELAGHVLGGPPTIVELDAWWSHPAVDESFGPQVLHRDKDDFRACKFFMYLTDVNDVDDGPHEYVTRTHDPAFVAQRLSELGHVDKTDALFRTDRGGRGMAQDVAQIFAGESIDVYGPGGTCFLDNSSGYHRGKAPRRRVRGMISVTYGMVAYPLRLERCAEVACPQLPPDCIDTDLARRAARLLLNG